jgi:hypothetical protein
MAGARTRGAGRDVKNHPPLLTCFHASSWSHALRLLQRLSTRHRGLAPQFAAVDHVGPGFCKQQLWKRNFAARDSWPCPQRSIQAQRRNCPRLITWATGPSQRATLETEICGQRLLALRAKEGRLNAPNRVLRPLFGTQVTEISRYFRPWEITSVRADFLVERRGFKLMVIVA